MSTGYRLLRNPDRPPAQVLPGDFARFPALRPVCRGSIGGFQPAGDALPAAIETEGSLRKSSSC